MHLVRVRTRVRARVRARVRGRVRVRVRVSTAERRTAPGRQPDRPFHRSLA